MIYKPLMARIKLVFSHSASGFRLRIQRYSKLMVTVLFIARRRRKILWFQTSKNTFFFTKTAFQTCFMKQNKRKSSKKFPIWDEYFKKPPPCYRFWTNKGGFLKKGGFLNLNTPDRSTNFGQFVYIWDILVPYKMSAAGENFAVSERY